VRGHSARAARRTASTRPRAGLEHVLTALASLLPPLAAVGDLNDVVDATVDAVPGWASISAQIVLLVVAAVLLRWLVHRAINRVVRRAIAAPGVSETVRQRLLDQSASLLAERRRQRTETVGSVLRSLSSIVIFAVTTATVLGEVGVELGPLLASAGIVGVALGFGAQNLVKDFLNGIFMILEDQYGVGDAIDAGEASGIVESVGLRVTRLRSVDGTVWHIRNGEIVRIGNMSQGWSRALLDVSVAYGTDVDQAQDVIKAVADGLWRDEEFGPLVLDEPEVWGVEMLGADGIAIRLVVKTAPLEQWKVARELRRRLKEAFDAHGIEIPFPQRALWLRTAPGEAPSPVLDRSDSAPSPARPPAATAPEPDASPSKRRTAAGGEADVARADTGAMRRPSAVRQVGEVEGPYDDGQRPAAS
jgi:moderate conductance mechanosensitive channel